MDYITCPHSKSEYKVSVQICEVCKRKKKCSDYWNYLQPPLFPQALIPKADFMYKRKKRPRNTALEICEALEGPEQLPLNI
jgi:hypothetical protein